MQLHELHFFGKLAWKEECKNLYQQEVANDTWEKTLNYTESGHIPAKDLYPWLALINLQNSNRDNCTG